MYIDGYLRLGMNTARMLFGVGGQHTASKISASVYSARAFLW